MVREWKPMSNSKRARVLRSATNRIFLHKYSLKLQMISKQIVYRIKLPCESTYVFDVNKYPPKPLPKKRPGRPHENRFENAPAEATTRCGICGQLGHNQLTCEYYEVWFDWNDPNDMVFRNIFSHALNPNRNGVRQNQ